MSLTSSWVVAPRQKSAGPWGLWRPHSCAGGEFLDHRHALSAGRGGAGDAGRHLVVGAVIQEPAVF